MNGLDQLLDFNAAALRIRAHRQEILAANIANVDTPNFKARDIDFKSAMQKALESSAEVSGKKNGAPQLNTTSPLHFKGEGVADVGAVDSSDLLYRSVVQDSADGNTVDADVERSAFVNNALRYEASVMMINARLKEMNIALQP
ncbi:flagellar basal body rod protein FlgB [Polynucleobacter sp. UK-Mo-2m-Kol15]|uniref:flagellar basal body rod protein FlgB n=1 Tax=Polynucleobacter sp. UK-Mo-2m-Kol15 TaxID=2576916 RepID=UPI001C0DF338|nr:flagellar basal body rod protein FlgB [Polynucleobacter sp. UK-Mo-2m-Kol15]MBU3575920.1 flagellar basal body rod protein FlgB [Polynucleobacter sp. UK-Mo-2m-Kol15]